MFQTFFFLKNLHNCTAALTLLITSSVSQAVTHLFIVEIIPVCEALKSILYLIAIVLHAAFTPIATAVDLLSISLDLSQSRLRRRFENG